MPLCKDCDHFDKHDSKVEGLFSPYLYYCSYKREYVGENDTCRCYTSFPKIKRGPVDGKSCQKCKHFYKKESRGFFSDTTYYCAYQETQVDTNNYCRGFVLSSDCFLTSACVTYYGKPDDCVELQTLRCFRDSYLRQTEQGQKLVNEYYEIAPSIVEKIEALTEKDIYYQYIYGVVLECVDLITQNDYEAAQEKYVEMTRKLKKDLLDD